MADEWTQLHVNKFPATLRTLMEDWGAAQVPDLALRQVVISACREWAERHIKNSPEQSELHAEIEHMERKLAELKSTL